MKMRTRTLIVAAIFTAAVVVTIRGQQQTGPQGQTPPTFFPTNYIGWEVDPSAVKVSEGFTPIFNGRSLAGWHVSRTNHHGRTPDFFVLHGAIIATQNPLGGGGTLTHGRSAWLPWPNPGGGPDGCCAAPRPAGISRTSRTTRLAASRKGRLRSRCTAVRSAGSRGDSGAGGTSGSKSCHRRVPIGA
jgi:hypothetical protein